MLAAQDLLAGSALSFEVDVPEEVLSPGGTPPADARDRKIRLRPLTVSDLQLISRAAKENDSLTAALMVHRALVDPELGLSDVSAMHVGLLGFLLEKVNAISGIELSAAELLEASDAPLVRAAFVLSREFGWTPEQVNELTLGQVLLHLELLRRSQQPG